MIRPAHKTDDDEPRAPLAGVSLADLSRTSAGFRSDEDAGMPSSRRTAGKPGGKSGREVRNPATGRSSQDEPAAIDAPSEEGGERRSGRKKASPAILTATRIRNIAEFYVSQREVSSEMLRAVLNRRLAARLRSIPEDARAGEADEAGLAIEAEISRLVRAGLINDQRFAEMKARHGYGSGRGSRRMMQDLQRKGIDPEAAKAAMVEAARELSSQFGADEDPDQLLADAEMAAAERYARKKRFGPFRREPLPEDPARRRAAWQKEAASMARAGFSLDVIRSVLDREPDEDS